MTTIPACARHFPLKCSLLSRKRHGIQPEIKYLKLSRKYCNSTLEVILHMLKDYLSFRPANFTSYFPRKEEKIETAVLTMFTSVTPMAPLPESKQMK